MYYRRQMDAIRSMVTNNRSSIMNALYIAIFLIATYYAYKFFTSAGEDAYLSGGPLVAGGNSDVAQRVYLIADSDKRKKFRIREGGDFAFSTWIYISSYSSHNNGLAKPVFLINDAGVSSNYLLTGVLYPNENKMMIRAFTGNSGTTTDPTGKSGFTTLSQSAGLFTGDMSICDIQNIDLQRWINLTISISGRIMDVYMDGKLTRSCILPNPIRASDTGSQSIEMVPNSGFGGYFSYLRFFNYAPTPDTIYANYQAGPYEGKGFLTYLQQMIGIKFQYTNASGVLSTTGSTA